MPVEESHMKMHGKKATGVDFELKGKPARRNTVLA